MALLSTSVISSRSKRSSAFYCLWLSGLATSTLESVFFQQLHLRLWYFSKRFDVEALNRASKAHSSKPVGRRQHAREFVVTAVLALSAAPWVTFLSTSHGANTSFTSAQLLFPPNLQSRSWEYTLKKLTLLCRSYTTNAVRTDIMTLLYWLSWFILLATPAKSAVSQDSTSTTFVPYQALPTKPLLPVNDSGVFIWPVTSSVQSFPAGSMMNITWETKLSKVNLWLVPNYDWNSPCNLVCKTNSTYAPILRGARLMCQQQILVKCTSNGLSLATKDV